MMLPGFSTALQPMSVWSPSSAPNLRRPVSNGRPSMSTVTLPGTSLTLEIFTPAPRCDLVAEDRVADVIEMGGDRVVEQERVLHLAGVAHDAVVADDDVLADVGVVADLAVAADDGRAFDHRAVLDHRAFADEDLLADERDAFAAVVQPGTEVGLEVGLDLLQRIPGIFAPVKDRRMRGLAEVEQVRWLEHGCKLGESRLAANHFFS